MKSWAQDQNRKSSLLTLQTAIEFNTHTWIVPSKFDYAQAYFDNFYKKIKAMLVYGIRVVVLVGKLLKKSEKNITNKAVFP